MGTYSSAWKDVDPEIAEIAKVDFELFLTEFREAFPGMYDMDTSDDWRPFLEMAYLRGFEIGTGNG